MEEPKKKINGLSGDALKTLQKEFIVIGKTHIKAWHAWLILGIVAGITVGVLFVANRSGEFESGRAEPSQARITEDEEGIFRALSILELEREGEELGLSAEDDASLTAEDPVAFQDEAAAEIDID